MKNIVLISNTGEGKSTLGNFLLYPKQIYAKNCQMSNETNEPYNIIELPFKTGSGFKPTTDSASIFNNDDLSILDTPGFDDFRNDHNDLDHIMGIYKQMIKMKKINAIIFCHKIDTKIDQKFKTIVDT